MNRRKSAWIIVPWLSLVPVAYGQQEMLRIPGEASATGNATAGTPTGDLSSGVEYAFEGGYFRGRINFGAAGFEVKGAQRDFAALVLQPDVRGVSAALDYAQWWALRDRFYLGYGVGLRASPFTTWAYEVTTEDPITHALTTTTIRDSVVVGSGLAALVLHWKIHDGDPVDVSFGIDAGFSVRGLLGTGAQTPALLANTLGTTERVFYGFDVRAKLKLGDIAFFAGIPVHFGAQSDVFGLTGPQFVIGAEVQGTVFQTAIGGSAGAPAPGGPGAMQVEDVEDQPRLML